MPSKHSLSVKNRHVRVGISGGVGSGKSLACKYFEDLGYNVIYADNIAKELYRTNKQLKQSLVKEFGTGLMDENGNISRQNARRIIFTSKRNIKRVNSIVHPFVISEVDRLVNKTKARVVLIETAIMFETGYYTRNDYNVLIYANKSLRMQRVRERDNVTLASVKKLMALQMDEAKKAEMADFIIKNNGTQAELKKNIKLFSKILDIL